MPRKGEKMSEQQKRKIGLANSISLLGHTVTEKTKKKLSKVKRGANNPFYGKCHSITTKEKIKQALLGNTNNKGKHWKVSKRGRINMSKGQIERVKNGTHNFYKHGNAKKNKILYYDVKYKIWRDSVFKRDNYTCQKCGFSGSKGYITAHHIKSFSFFPKLRFNINNGITLCEKCHSKTDNYKGRSKRKELTLCLEKLAHRNMTI